MKNLIVVIIILLTSTQAYAYTWSSTYAEIRDLRVAYNGIFGQLVGQTLHCDTGNFRVAASNVPDLLHEELVSFLLAAFVSKTKVKVLQRTGACVNGNTEIVGVRMYVPSNL